MIRRWAAIGVVLAGMIVAGTLVRGAEERRTITEKDLLDFVWLADPQLSPDHTQVAFVRVTVDPERDTYASAIWSVPLDGSTPMRPLTAGPRDTSPRWAPDGRRLAFIRTIESEGKPESPQVFMLEMTGGDAAELVHLPGGAGDAVWAADGTHLAVLSATTPPEAAPEPGRPSASDVRVITHATFRDNGAGYREPLRRHRLYLVSLDGNAHRRGAHPLSGGRISEDDPSFSPDGSTLYFTSRDAEEADFAPPRTLVYAAPVAGGLPHLVATVDGSASRLAPSPDGRRLAFIGTANPSPDRSYQQPDLFTIDVATGAVDNLTASYDFDIGGGLTGDQRAPRGAGESSPAWTPDSMAIDVIGAAEGRANLIRVDLAQGVTTITAGAHEVQEFSRAADGATTVLLMATPTSIGDLYRLTPGPAPPIRLTAANATLFDRLDLPEPKEFRFTSFDGRQVQGWVVTPPSFDPSRKYPLILQIHGGPHAAYGATFTHEFLTQAAHGYVVLYVNPRGSTTYGQEFGNLIQYRYPGDDFKDLMRAVDIVLERGYIDPARLCVTGGSGGGLLTNWTIGHTTRFHAAVSQRSIADWEAWWYAADFTLFRPRWFRDAPWRDRADFEARSPITYADAIETPLMLVDGDADLRTPPVAGGEAMFRALKMRHVPVVMVRVPEETHELSRSGRPWHRIDRLRYIQRWFDKWIEGKPFPEYDTAPGVANPTAR